jgi:simple sugar transport system ATP-binding protein
MALTSEVSVMRQGEMVGHKKTESTNKEELAEMMVGRSVLLRINKTEAKKGEIVFRVNNLQVKDDLDVMRVKDVNFEIHKGEILGLAGVTGNGQTELLEALSGIRKIESGEIQLFNETISDQNNFLNPKELKEKGLVHVPEDRQRMGLINDFKAYENLIFGYHHQLPFSKSSILKEKDILSHSRKVMEAYDVRPQSPHLITSNFSGGNQQKIILSRELNKNPKVLLVGQPTRGVDIGAIEFIHQRLIDMRNKGVAILLVSVELEEVLSLSDRIVVMFDGKLVGEKVNKNVTDREIGLLMAGIA